MKAIVIRAHGGPEVLALEEVPDPVPAPDEVVIKVHAVSVNPTLDIATREGRYPRAIRFPHVPGVDPAGVIVAVGAAVEGRRTGHRVWADFILGCGRCSACLEGNWRACRDNRMLGVDCWGGYAERVAVPARNTYLIPEGLGYGEATVIARHLPVAMYLLEDLARLQQGEWVLVMGAAGGLGSAAVQLARHMGARVIAAAGSEQRVAAAVGMGAISGVNYRTRDLADEVMKLTDGRGVDVVVENIADPELWTGAFNSLGRGGRLVTAGAHGGGRVALDVQQLYLKRLSILGGAGMAAQGVERSLLLAEQGLVSIPIDRILPLSRAREAQELVGRRQNTGKVVIDPSLDAVS